MVFKFLRSPRFLISAGIGLAAVSMAVLIFEAKTDARWQAMEDLLQEIQSDLDSQSYVREPLGGQGIAGLAWDGYADAYEGMRKHTDVIKLGKAVFKASVADAESRSKEAVRLVEILYEELAAVQRGAGCLDATPPIDWSKGTEQRVPTLLDTAVLVDVLILQGLAEIEKGNVPLGCGMILDGIQFGEDLARSPRLISQIYGVSQFLPLSLRRYLEHEGLGFSSLKSFDQGAAMALAPRWTSAGGFLALADCYDQLQGLRGQALHERAMELTDSHVPFTNSLMIAPSAEGGYRHNLVLLAQLRRALRIHLMLPPLPFVDPHGESLTESHDGGFFDFSVGPSTRPVQLRIKR